MSRQASVEETTIPAQRLNVLSTGFGSKTSDREAMSERGTVELVKRRLTREEVDSWAASGCDSEKVEDTVSKKAFENWELQSFEIFRYSPTLVGCRG